MFGLDFVPVPHTLQRKRHVGMKSTKEDILLRLV